MWHQEERPIRALNMNRRSSLKAGGGGGVRGVFLLVSKSFEKRFNLSRSSKEL